MYASHKLFACLFFFCVCILVCPFFVCVSLFFLYACTALASSAYVPRPVTLSFLLHVGTSDCLTNFRTSVLKASGKHAVCIISGQYSSSCK